MKKYNILGIFGIGGFAREILPLVRSQVANKNNTKIVFVVDEEYLPKDRVLNGVNVYSFEEFLEMPAATKQVTIAFAEIEMRKQVFEKCTSNDIEMVNIYAENTVVMDNVEIGEGAILCPFVTITSDVVIGKGFQANLYSYVAHDCRIGDFVTFAPGVKCNGNVVIEDGVYIGTGAIIFPGKKDKPLVIGKNSIISAGSVVISSIPSGKTYFGNPAIEFTKENIKRRS